jgi:hypothetical protein
MRKLLAVGLVSFVTSAVALSGVSQPRRPPRGPRRPPAAAVVAEPPVSPRIAQELGTLRWGINHEQVIEYFRQMIRASYAPRMRNLGQVEQYRMVEQRDVEIRAVERTYVAFDGVPAHRRWDTSFIGEEYTHNNNESMLVYEDRRGNREFFFFINDRLWKRVQARNTAGQRASTSTTSPRSSRPSSERVGGDGRPAPPDGGVARRDHAPARRRRDDLLQRLLPRVRGVLRRWLELPTLRRNVPTAASDAAPPSRPSPRCRRPATPAATPTRTSWTASPGKIRRVQQRRRGRGGERDAAAADGRGPGSPGRCRPTAPRGRPPRRPRLLTGGASLRATVRIAGRPEPRSRSGRPPASQGAARRRRCPAARGSPGRRRRARPRPRRRRGAPTGGCLRPSRPEGASTESTSARNAPCPCGS